MATALSKELRGNTPCYITDDSTIVFEVVLIRGSRVSVQNIATDEYDTLSVDELDSGHWRPLGPAYPV